MRAAIYARVSTFDQEPENQLQELRRCTEARGWSASEFVDRGVSGAKDRRPALDQMIVDAKRRKFDIVVCWRLSRWVRGSTARLLRESSNSRYLQHWRRLSGNGFVSECWRGAPSESAGQALGATACNASQD